MPFGMQECRIYGFSPIASGIVSSFRHLLQDCPLHQKALSFHSLCDGAARLQESGTNVITCVLKVVKNDLSEYVQLPIQEEKPKKIKVDKTNKKPAPQLSLF